MGARTVKHDKHEHVLKTVNEEISGVLMDDRGTDKVSETFGWEYKKFEECMDKMEAFFLFQDAADKLYDAGEPDMLPQSTKTSQFADFIKSSSFKQLGIKLETPNDYLMIGFIYCGTITKVGIEDLLDRYSGRGVDPEKMLVLLETFRKAIGERN